VKRWLVLTALLTAVPSAEAADIEAGKARVATVCAACHGANGVSVSDTIPNLAAQRARYLETQLRALKDGTRTNPIMNAIAAQPGAQGAAKSAFLPNVARTGVTFPEDYKAAFTKYHTINFPATKQVRYYYANKAALAAAKADKPLPNGSVLFVEVYSAKLDADKKPLTGADGFYLADQLLFFTAMARDAGWGKDIPEMLRNEDWNYAAFTTGKQHRPINQAECLACHKPLDKVSFTFTLKQLTDIAKGK
jgi:hypothetical protein